MTELDQKWEIEWDCGRAQVHSLGAMVGPVYFRLENGREIQPFQIAPWIDSDNPEHSELPGILKRLRGEWPCVPFGMPGVRYDLPDIWLEGLKDTSEPVDSYIHGESANKHWHIVNKQKDSLTLEFNYSEKHPIKKLTRVIKGVAGESALFFSLTVESRCDIELPIGLHPVFRLPEKPAGVRLSFHGDVNVISYPVQAEPDISMALENHQNQSLEKILCTDGSVFDASRHPLPFTSEELLLVIGADGSAQLDNEEEDYTVSLDWNDDDFPACMLWISNGGRKSFPWSGRFQAIGVEPVAAAFDLGVAHSQNKLNPLSKSGIKCTQLFTAEVPWVTEYKISATSFSRNKNLHKTDRHKSVILSDKAKFTEKGLQI